MLGIYVGEPVFALEEGCVRAQATRLGQDWLGSLGPLAHDDVGLRATAFPIVNVPLERVVQIVEGVVAAVIAVVACTV